jgi:hypothetical protein
MAQANSMSASWVAPLVSSRILSFLNWCSHESERSTTHRVFPSPLPCGVRRLAKTGSIPFS